MSQAERNGRVKLVLAEVQREVDKAALDHFPLSFWYTHRIMGNVMQRYGFTLEALGRLRFGDYAEAHRGEAAATVRCLDGFFRRGANRDWTGTTETRWWHWRDLFDIPNVGPRRMLELVNFLRIVGAELPWFADFDAWTADLPALQGQHREPKAES
jgi:hypothetical protein